MCQTGSLVNSTNNNENKVVVSVLFFNLFYAYGF